MPLSQHGRYGCPKSQEVLFALFFFCHPLDGDFWQCSSANVPPAVDVTMMVSASSLIHLRCPCAKSLMDQQLSLPQLQLIGKGEERTVSHNKSLLPKVAKGHNLISSIHA